MWGCKADIFRNLGICVGAGRSAPPLGQTGLNGYMDISMSALKHVQCLRNQGNTTQNLKLYLFRHPVA